MGGGDGDRLVVRSGGGVGDRLVVRSGGRCW